MLPIPIYTLCALSCVICDPGGRGELPLEKPYSACQISFLIVYQGYMSKVYPYF